MGRDYLAVPWKRAKLRITGVTLLYPGIKLNYLNGE